MDISALRKEVEKQLQKSNAELLAALGKGGAGKGAGGGGGGGPAKAKAKAKTGGAGKPQLQPWQATEAEKKLMEVNRAAALKRKAIAMSAEAGGAKSEAAAPKLQKTAASSAVHEPPKAELQKTAASSAAEGAEAAVADAEPQIQQEAAPAPPGGD